MRCVSFLHLPGMDLTFHGEAQTLTLQAALRDEPTGGWGRREYIIYTITIYRISFCPTTLPKEYLIIM